MGSINHPRLYDPAAMASIKAAFYEVWMALEAQHAVDRKDGATELKATIIRRLMDLASNGTTHPEEMKAEVLKMSTRLASPKSNGGPYEGTRTCRLQLKRRNLSLAEHFPTILVCVITHTRSRTPLDPTHKG